MIYRERERERERERKEREERDEKVCTYFWCYDNDSLQEGSY